MAPSQLYSSKTSLSAFVPRDKPCLSKQGFFFCYNIVHMSTSISLPKSELLLSKSKNSSTDTIVLFLPGISGKAFSDRFQSVVDISLKTGYPIARMSAWESEADVQQKTYFHYQSAVIEALEHLHTLGYKKIIAIGKSFGGGLFLSLHHDAIIKKILWAPALGFAQVSTLEKLRNETLSQIENLKEIKLSPSFLSSDKAKLCFIHGTEDTAIPISTSRAFALANPNAHIVEVKGADHSFKTPESERELNEATEQFLRE